MRTANLLPLVCLLGWSARAAVAAPDADTLRALDARAAAVASAGAEAALDLSTGNPGRAVDGLADALADARGLLDTLADDDVALELGRRRARNLRRRLIRLEDRTVRARTDVQNGATSPFVRNRSLRRMVVAGLSVRRLLRPADLSGFELRLAGRHAHGFLPAGARVPVRFVRGRVEGGGVCTEDPVFTVEDLPQDAGGSSVGADVASVRRDRYLVILGDDAGGGRVTATACGTSRTWTIVNTGRRGTLGREPVGTPPPPAAPDYGEMPIHGRLGSPLSVAPSMAGGVAHAFTSDPTLPAGLALDRYTGEISGTPLEGPSNDGVHTITATNPGGSASTDVTLRLGAPLPDGMEYLEPDFTAEVRYEGLDMPTRVVESTDLRLFFTERGGGLRVARAMPLSPLLSPPLATVDVVTDGEQGLLGLCLAPDFIVSGHLYVYATVPATQDQPVRNQVIRYTVVGSAAVAPEVVIDDLPAGFVHNGGEIAFGPDGKLYVSVGDAGDPALAQQIGSLAGRILRYEADGSVPTDNPDPTSPEWCRGLRNTFGFTFHPTLGGLFGAENGPASDDELNFLQAGKNYEWGGLPDGFPGALVGPRIFHWRDVIVPTAPVFHDGVMFGPEYADNLFLANYDQAEIRRMVMSGTSRTDVDEELVFARFRDDGILQEKPLDIDRAPSGYLVVSTFTSIYVIYR